MTKLLLELCVNNQSKRTVKCYNFTRFLILILAILSCTLVFANLTLFNFAIISLANEVKENSTVIGDEARKEETYFYTADEFLSKTSVK